MKALIHSLVLFVACLFAGSVAHAQCLPATPSSVRTGVVYKADGTAAGAWAYWWCVSGTTVTYEWRAAPVSSFSSTVMSNLRSYAMGTNPGFVSTPTTLAKTDPALAPLRAAIILAVATDAGKPQPAATK